MRKIYGFIVVVLLFFIIYLLSMPMINNYNALQIANKLEDLPLPNQTQFIESIYKAGKLVGNGNGMQYFGAILISSNLSLEELDAYYSNYRSNEWEYLVEVQKGQSIEVIDHGIVQFSEEVGKDEYYIVYSWGDSNSALKEFDMRGH